MNKSDQIKEIFDGLKAVQKEMFLKFFNSKSRKNVFHCARRLGKTYALVSIACCVALYKPNQYIRFATYTQKALKNIVLPIFKTVWADIPASQRPKYNSQSGVYKFLNGSEIHLAGVNNGRADTLRGTSADLCLIDEAGFVDDLSYLVESVMLPQLINNPDAKLIMASSSPLTPAHEFVEYVHQAVSGDFYSGYDIYKGEYPQHTIDEFCRESGGPNSTTWRREYLNEIIVDTEISIIPEWNDSLIQEIPRNDVFPYSHKYVAMDVGFRDKTAIIFGYYDFPSAKLIIEDEFTISGVETTTKNISEAVKQKESELGYKPYRRIGDNNNLILLNDLSVDFNLHFTATDKEALSAMVNEARLWVQNKRIAINPKCEQLIGCLKYGVFQNEKRQEFGRSRNYGHYDTLAALIYLVRNIDQSTNPIPVNHKANFDTFIAVNETDNSHLELKKIFNL